MSSASDADLSTSLSLIARVQSGDRAAWNRFACLYSPFVYGICRANGLQPNDAHDVSQEILMSMMGSISSYRPQGSFRGWVSTVTRNRVRDFFRGNQRRPAAVGGTDFHEQMQTVIGKEDAEPTLVPSGDDPLLRRAVDLLRSDFESETFQAFWRMAVDGLPAEAVARELRWITSESAPDRARGARRVRQAKLRVLHRLRSEFGELVEIPG